jgi:hypothetical protein
VSVVLFPFLSEQGRRGQVANVALPRLHKVPSTFQKLIPHVRVVPLVRIRGREIDFVGSSLFRFLSTAWGSLKRCNVLVTHRNFLANEVLQRYAAAAGSIPNAAVVLVRVRHLSGADPTEEKQLYLVRHCTSHHNVTHLGDHLMTTCATVEALRRIAPVLRKAFQDQDVLYGSSILPRAILSSISLQRPVTEAELKAVRQAFSSKVEGDVADEQGISGYIDKHSCSRTRAAGAFCSEKPGTFTLGPDGSRAR